MSDDGSGSKGGDSDGVFRRDVLKASGAAAVALGLGGGGYASSLAETATERLDEQVFVA